MINSISRRHPWLTVSAAAVALTASLAALEQSPAPAAQPASPPQAAPPAPAGPTGFTTAPALKFRAQEIATDFGVGYAIVAGDVNGDKVTDLLAISGTELVRVRAPSQGQHA